MRYDYGNPARGLSFEETNLRSALEGMGHDVVPFDFMERESTVGRRRMRDELIDVASVTQPDLAFFVLFTDQIDPGTIGLVGERNVRSDRKLVR